MKRLLGSRLTTLISLAAGVGLIFFLYRSSEGLKLGNPIPSFSLKSQSKELVSSDRYRGDVLLVHFWASWCGPCLSEFPGLEKLNQFFKGKGLTILAINSDLGTFEGAQKKVAEFRNHVHFSFPVLYDFQGAVAKLYGVYQLPVTFVVDRDGTLAAVEMGASDWLDAKHQKMIQTLLRAPLKK